MPIKKIIAFGSAKGGVGKSSITASIALSLSKTKTVGILDADIYGPNQNILFEINEKPSFDASKSIKPIKKNNIQIISMGSILDQDKAAAWRGPMISAAIKQLINSTKWGNLDYLLIDMPPGTGDAYLTVFKEIKVNHFILVTTPNRLAISDAQKTISLLEKLDVDILGYILNNIYKSEDTLNDKLFPKNIKNLGNFNFDINIYNFDINYESQEAADITAVIEANV
tara:strand:- start:3129 stop:3806 length:678 start_codon:yes stop_codon:yes gene_type:complete